LSNNPDREIELKYLFYLNFNKRASLLSQKYLLVSLGLEDVFMKNLDACLKGEFKLGPGQETTNLWKHLSCP
jgi:hypothetical protein